LLRINRWISSFNWRWSFYRR